MLQGKVARLASQQSVGEKKWEVGSWCGVDDVAEKLVAGNQQSTKLAAAALAPVAAPAPLLPRRIAHQQKSDKMVKGGLPVRRTKILADNFARCLCERHYTAVRI